MRRFGVSSSRNSFNTLNEKKSLRSLPLTAQPIKASKQQGRTTKRLKTTFLVFVASAGLTLYFWKEKRHISSATTSEKSTLTQQQDEGRCTFRSYPPNRYYGLTTPFSEQPDFLANTLYIRGEPPQILDVSSQSSTSKICLNTSSWETEITTASHRPFTDGHNPSIVSLSPNPHTNALGKSPRLNPMHSSVLNDLFGSLDNKHISISVFGNGQCGWKMSDDQIREYEFSPRKDAPTYRTVVAIHAEDFGVTLGQATLLLEQDAEWGTARPRQRVKMEKDKNSGNFVRSVQQFDDPRFFFHDGMLWVLYRNGPKFGYNDQIHNRVHFERKKSNKENEAFIAYIKASETIRVCCGRNIALIAETEQTHSISSNELPPLKALTWVDPVTVVDVDLSTLERGTGIASRKLQEMPTNPSRKLAGVPKSHIHGTNGYMVPLATTDEWLGIAHFHRPEKTRDTSEYALHGHHYSHTLFTIKKNMATADGSFQLSRISNEFVFASQSPPTIDPDADIIQFAAGIDLLGSDTKGKLLLSYGINDCEGAVLSLSMVDVQTLLKEVDDGDEVANLMKPPDKTRFAGVIQ